MEESDQNGASTSSSSNNGDPSAASAPSSSSSSPPSSSSSPSSSSHVEEEDENREQEQEEREREEAQREEQEQEQQQQQGQIGVNFVPIPLRFAESLQTSDDAWSCLVVLVTFWFFASMTIILGLYGSSDLQLGPYCSDLLQSNSFFVREIKVQELTGPKNGMMLYGFKETPPLDVDITWSETHGAFLEPNNHKEWVYFLNKGSAVDVMYNVSESSMPLSLVIAQGQESFIAWIEDPSYPNLTLSWNIIQGNGTIRQEIYKSSYYYVAVGNLNPVDIEVKLSITIQALVYNTSKAYSKCSLAHGACGLNLDFLGTNVAVLTSPGPEQDTSTEDWYVKLSYEPRWISYLLGSGLMTLFIILVFKACMKIQSNNQAGEGAPERAPLLTRKDDDILSWGSSYDSVSNDDEDLEDLAVVTSLEAKPLKDGENINPRRLCVICYDAPRDCFFLPCGHCAACFTCGTRIVEDAGTCPICRRKMKKVRKIFAV